MAKSGHSATGGGTDCYTMHMESTDSQGQQIGDGSSSLVRLVQVLNSVEPTALLKAAQLLLLTRPPFTISDLARVQRQLRAEAPTWTILARYHVTAPERVSDLRSSLNRKAEELRKMNIANQSQGRDAAGLAFAVTLEWYALGEAIIRWFRDGPMLPAPSEVAMVRGHLLGRVLDISNGLCESAKVRNEALTELREMLEECSSLFDRAQLSAGPTDHRLGKDTFAMLGAPLIAEHWTQAPLSRERLMAWASCRIIEYLTRVIFRADITCDCFVPSGGSGEFRILASSQTHPGQALESAGRLGYECSLMGRAAAITPAVLVAKTSSPEWPSKPVWAVSVPFLARPSGQESRGFFFLTSATDLSGNESPFLALISVVAECLAARLSGRKTEVDPELLARRIVRSPDDFTEALTDHLQSVMNTPPRVGRMRLVIVSARKIGLDAEGIEGADSGLFESWAKYTALRMADGRPTFRIGAEHAYVFFAEGRGETEGSGKGNDTRRLVEIHDRNGDLAGVLGIWNVVWRNEQLADAVELLGLVALADLIRSQVETSAVTVVELNDLISEYAAGHYQQAFGIAKRLVSSFASDCGIAVNYGVRLALLVGDYTRALEDSAARKHYAPWDIEAHANYLFALLALGRHDDALAEVGSCEVCSGHRLNLLQSNPGQTSIEPMLLLALSLVEMNEVRTTHVLWRLNMQVEAAIRTLAPTHPLSRAVRNAIEEVRRYLHGQRDDPPTSLLEGLYLSLDDAEVRLPKEQMWTERERLHRIVVILLAISRTSAQRKAVPTEGF